MKILLGVCGSISAYKSIDLARGLVKKGHEVRVILTRGANEFIRPNIFSYLGVEKVYNFDSDFDYPKNSDDKGSVLHIELAKWADRILICPLSANTLSSLAMGRANDLLTSVYLATSENVPVILFPAMNTLMYEHPITQANIDLVQRLQSTQNTFIYPPEIGLLACGDTGAGKLPDVEKILETFDLYTLIPSRREKIVITTGATLAPLDPVRYLTNSSSGKTGYTLAKKALSQGFEVTVLAGIHATKELDYLKCHPNYKLIRLTTTKEMLTHAMREMDDAIAYISSAALCDFEFNYQDSKIKKEKSHGNVLTYSQAPDVLKEIIAHYKMSGVKIIGFAAETDLSENILKEKWLRKPVDLLIGTHVHGGFKGQAQKGFATDGATYSFFSEHGISFHGELSKDQLADYLIESLIK